MHARVRNPKQRVELQQKPQLWQVEVQRLACASHCTPLLSRRSSSSVVRASLAQSATSIAALARCQGSPLARLTAWMDDAARPPVNAAASSSTAAFGALPQLCEAYAASAG